MLDTKYIQSLKNILFSKLIHLDIVKHGQFILKNGTQSSIYMDLRQLVNYPQFFKYLTKLLFLQYPHLLETFNSNHNVKLIPIPLGGLPLGFHLAAEHNIPLLMIRDKAKDHGMKRMIEGVIEADDEYYIIEDVITSGKSINEALDLITPVFATSIANTTSQQNNNLEYAPSYKAIICICNRGGMESMGDGIPIYSIFNLAEIEEYIATTKSSINIGASVSTSTSIVNYFRYTTPFTNELYGIALRKKSNLIISCDFMTNQEIIDLLKLIGDRVIAVKLHIDMLDAKTYSTFIEEIKTLKSSMGFLVIEDAKFADIDAIMIEKINHSMMDIKSMADAVTIHGISGLSILENNKLVIPGIVVAEMSSRNNMISSDYSKSIINFVRDIRYNRDVRDNRNHDSRDNELSLGGLVCQSSIPKMLEPFEMLTMSPGININTNVKTDDLNQRYSIPNLRNNRIGLFWIVGRGITNYKKQEEKLIDVVKTYQQLGWDYFIKY
jgi:orotidine 5'-phosphate decarboxylase subfamily 1/orotate phosphoribosyltransferase